MDLREQLQQAMGPGYAVDRELDGGGMSRVFLVKDTGLKRDIVAKILRPELLTGVSVERFEREIMLVAALQHPHIVPLLSAGHLAPAAGAPGPTLPYFTMPFIRGESLRTRLSRSGELPIGETVHLLRAIAAALAHAHGEGVVHRDIKPENVLLSGGVAVVTDFGVAKAVNSAVAGATPGRVTSIGVALGTPAYMSPEQAGGDPNLDHRSDIYSFGCLAYELLSGSVPFPHRPPQQMLAAHVTEAVEPLSQRRPKVPAALSALVMRCLEKRPSDRPQSAEELLVALDAVTTPSGGLEPTAARVAPRVSTRVWIGASVVLAAVVGFLVWRKLTAFRPLTVQSNRMVIQTSDLESEPAISPDGKLVAYLREPEAGGQAKLFVRQLDRAASTPLSEAVEGTHRNPRWSPDGSEVFFVAQTAGGVAGYVVPYLGGTPRQVIPPVSGLGILNPVWSRDGRGIAFNQGPVIFYRRLVAGAADTLRNTGEIPVSGLAYSPDGTRIAYVLGVSRRLGPRRIWTAPAGREGEAVLVSDSTSQNVSPAWAPDGRSIFYLSDRDGAPDVYQQRVSAAGAPLGAPSRITTGLVNAESFTLSAEGTRAAYAVANNRAPIFVVDIPGPGSSTPVTLRQVTKENGFAAYFDLSPDGKWLAYDSDRSGINQLYKVLAEGGESIQLTRDSVGSFVPKWSPDGSEIAYHRGSQSVNRDIFVMRAEGLDSRRVTSDTTRQEVQPAWSPDGNSMVFSSSGLGLMLTTRTGGKSEWSPPRQLTQDPVQSPRPRWSPDGNWIAYQERGSLRLVASAGGPSRTLVDSLALGAPIQDLAWRSDPEVLYVGVAERFRGAGPRQGVGRVASSFWAVRLDGKPPELILRFDARRAPADGAAMNPRISYSAGVSTDFATDGRRLFIKRNIQEADIGLLELKR